MAVAALFALLIPKPLYAQDAAPSFQVEEATIAEIHAAMLAGRLTARQLVETYLERIDAYDKSGPAINSLIALNPDALENADSLDAALRSSGALVGPLHGIPVIVKDNYDVEGLPTTAGSLVLEESLPPDHSFQVRRLREAGAIVLAKSNLSEFAFSAFVTVSSRLPGYTKNPYALDRSTAGSSGGTAAAVAANLGAVGLGTDTGNSIRGPASHTALVGIRSTLGLTSRDGIVPLNLDRDIGGPMARTVSDAVAVLDVIAGHDPADPVTVSSLEKSPPGGYRAHLKAGGLRGKRIGVLRQISDTKTADAEVRTRFEEALAALRSAGAVVVDPISIPGHERLRETTLVCRRFRHDLKSYLASLGDRAPVRTLEEVLDSRRFHPSSEPRLRYFAAAELSPEEDQACVGIAADADQLRAAVRRVLSEQRLDALVYPSWNNPPRLIGDLNTPHGNNSGLLAPPIGFPAITVPMGWVQQERLPVGLEIVGDAWSEPILIEIAYGYEQATRHRRAPVSTPPLPRGSGGAAAVESSH
ncbi:MAG: amidase [Acidobacteria bacterium]|nr:amidase [Acidobacteriota bacterium]